MIFSSLNQMKVNELTVPSKKLQIDVPSAGVQDGFLQGCLI
jgi:hypothetical protein